jgi:hypothetical protein
MSVEMVQLMVSVLGLMIAGVGLPLLYVQLRDVKRSVRGGVHAATYAQAADFRAHLVAHPHLRPYFFEAKEIAPDHADYNRVVTIAEIFLNYLEHVTVLEDSYTRQDRAALDRFTKHALAQSPILKRHLNENRAAYADALLRYAAG